MTREYDYLVIGSGIAGMSFALKVAGTGSVALICKSNLEDANTYFAQGGVASVTNMKVDNFDKHIEDTMIAGDWLSDPVAVRKVVQKHLRKSTSLLAGVLNLTRKKTGNSTFTAKAATLSSGYCTIWTTRGPKYNKAL